MKTRKSSKTQEILQNASDALDIARSLAPIIPVPVLCTIFITAKGIVDIAIRMRQEKRETAELAEHAATLAKNVHMTIRGKENLIDKDLSLSLNQLCSVLEEIKAFMERQIALRLWERLCTRSAISERLAEYRTRVEYVMQTFTTTSSLRQELCLNYLKDGMDDLKDTIQSGQTFDGQFRIFRWGEVEVLRSYDLPSNDFLSDIEVYDARIDGHVKVMKVYRDEKAFEHSRNILMLVRDRPGLPFAQLEGYTNASLSPFIVLKGGLTNMFEYLEDLDILDYFTERLRFMVDMKRAMRFLSTHGFRWKGWVERLMISESGRLAIGYADDIVPRLDTDSDGGISQIIISWPKIGIAEGLHFLIDRQDDILSPLHSMLQMSGPHYDLFTLSHIWGRYIDELSCGIRSYVTVTNTRPPPLASIGRLRPTEKGMHFDTIFSTYKGKINVRTTGQIRHRTNGDKYKEVPDLLDVRDWRNFEGESISMPLLVTEETDSLLCYRTTYAQLHRHSQVIEHLIQTCPNLFPSGDLDLESVAVVSAVIERTTVTFTGQSNPTDGWHKAVYFHPSPPDDSGFLRKPWGFLSEQVDTTTHDDITTQFTMEHSNSLTIGDITAHTEQSFELHCFQFSTAEAEALLHMYDIYQTRTVCR